MSSNVKEVNHLHKWQSNLTMLIVDVSLSLKRNEFTLTRPAHSPTEATNDNWESSNKLQKAVPRESQRKPQWCCQRTFQRLAIWCIFLKKERGLEFGWFWTLGWVRRPWSRIISSVHFQSEPSSAGRREILCVIVDGKECNLVGERIAKWNRTNNALVTG